MIPVTVTETITYSMNIDPNAFPEGYDFELDPDGLLDSYIADVTSTDDGSLIDEIDREIQIDN